MFTDQQDAFGELVSAYYNGKDVIEIVERDDGLIGTSAGPHAYFLEYDQWPEHYKTAIQLVHGRVVDVGSGAGRISLFLQKQGYEVLATDNSPKALKVCQLRGVIKTALCPITQLNSRVGIFDSIVMFGNNFGLFGNFKRAKWLLKRFHRMTSAQGRIIAESNDVYATDDPIHLAYHQRNRQRGRMAGQLRLRVRYQNLKTPWFDYLIVSQSEMKEIIQGTGWVIRQFINSEGPQYIAIIDKE
jgi:cyclopropane fatty-acyl-phospholipid synthase-like methyltransferase